MSAITRLGEGVDAERRLLPTAVARVERVLGEYRSEAERLGAERTLAAATSAVRDAVNGRDFLAELERRFGFATRLLSGGEEAELTLSDGADPHKVLEACMGRLRIRRFEVAAPSLEEIFIEKVGAEALEELP